MMQDRTLAGLRVLVVEDEVMVALLVEDLLQSSGCDVVGPVGTVAEALDLLARERIDGAVLDVNLGSDRVYPVADALRQLAVPFVFVTGYGRSGIARPYGHNPTIEKPFNMATFAQDVAAALGEPARGGAG